MGSQSNLNNSYIAGFLDGDGSLMLQVKMRNDTKRGIRFMATICFYQDTRHEHPLYWIKKVLKIGYISHRKDGITELRINGFEQVRDILNLLKPYIRFKANQASALLQACQLLSKKKIGELSDSEMKKLINFIFIIKKENYKSNSKIDKKVMYKRLGLTP